MGIEGKIHHFEPEHDLAGTELHLLALVHPNQIWAMYHDMLNKGTNYVPSLMGPPISIEQWRDRELAKIK